MIAGQLLVDAGIITGEQLYFVNLTKAQDEKVGDFLLQRKLITNEQLIQVLEYQLNITLL